MNLMNGPTPIPFTNLRQSPENARRALQGVHELADSIYRYGLRRGLLVKPDDAEGMHEIICGNRRYQALGWLAQTARLPVLHIPCLIKGSETDLAKVIEHVTREKLPPWELGFCYLNLSESGLTQVEIAARVGTTQRHVSTAIRVARGLAPRLANMLSMGSADVLSTQRLLRLAALSDDFGDPDEKAQLRLCENMLAAPVHREEAARRTRAEKDTVWQRYQRLKQGKLNRRIDPVYRPFVGALIRYLSGATAGIAT